MPKIKQKQYQKAYEDSDYVFTYPDGRAYNPGTITNIFSKVLAQNGFLHMRFHDLRHSCASILHDKVWKLKDIQTWLRHADIRTTANIYTHISQARKNNMAKDISNTF